MDSPSPARRWTVEDVLGTDGIAESVWPGYEPRDAQLRMTQAILERLQEGGFIAIEAPTGVGKTLAYLLASVLSGRKVVISTHTKTLQDQIIDSDLPKLGRLLQAMGWSLDRATPNAGPPEPRTVRYALMKGRQNYLCLAKLDRRTEQTQFAFAPSDRPMEQIRAWAQTTERGDRVELGALAEAHGLWSELDARSETCTGSRCPRYDACFVVRMRKEAQAAQLIVVNHHLLLSDLALKAEASLADRPAFGEVIPEVDALVLDEAHGFESVASEYFGGQVSLRKIDRLVQDVATYLGEGRNGSELNVLLTQAKIGAEALFRSLPRQEGRSRIPKPGPARRPWEAAREQIPRLEASFGALTEGLEHLDPSDPLPGHLARRGRDILEGIRFVLSAEDQDFVYWSESGKTAGSSALGASPILPSNLLNQYLFPRFGAVAMCSATLSAGGQDLQYFLSSMGAPEDTDSLVLGSPFDHARQAALFLPKNLGGADEPTNPERALPCMEALVNTVGGGALLLFTSIRAMQHAYRRLQGKLPYPCAMQGQASKRDLLADFVARAPAVLFATASFWEGVDVPGDPLRLVVIDRLPFDSPQDPLMAARAERLSEAGGRPFPELHLPRAILRLKQGFGRLLRSRHDRGIVAILDGRIRTRAYGRRFVQALPPVPRFEELDPLRRWWEEGPHGDSDGPASPTP